MRRALANLALVIPTLVLVSACGDDGGSGGAGGAGGTGAGAAGGAGQGGAAQGGGGQGGAEQGGGGQGGGGSGSSLRFFGTGQGAVDRVKIPLDAPARPVDVGAGDFTVELFLRALPGENDAAGCAPGPDNWIVGNIVVDRDVYGAGDYGDFGLSLFAEGLAVGVASASEAVGLCGATPVADGAWHHVAFTRRASDGRVQLFVDGALDATGTGPTGDISYRDGRSGEPNDPFLVLGAEKHDAGAAYPSFSGWVDELRVSTSVRYEAAFTSPTSPFVPDASTAALYAFDEGQGTLVSDTSGAVGGPSSGTLSVGGPASGPAWSSESPF